MIFCPLAGTPLITQGFGQNPDLYSQYGFLGHNGIDFGCPEGTQVFAPHDGIARLYDSGARGYGLYLVIEDANRLSLLAHLSDISVTENQRIYQGDPVAKSGNTGVSSGPHLHWTFKILRDGVVQNQGNGYDGAVDVSEFTRLWLDKDLHYDAEYTDYAREYLVTEFEENQYLKNLSRMA